MDCNTGSSGKMIFFFYYFVILIVCLYVFMFVCLFVCFKGMVCKSNADDCNGKCIKSVQFVLKSCRRGTMSAEMREIFKILQINYKNHWYHNFLVHRLKSYGSFLCKQ